MRALKWIGGVIKRAAGKIYCCCRSCVSIPDTFDVTVSGVDPCGCVGGILVLSSAPASFTLTRTVGDSWESDPTGSTSVFSPCDTFLTSAYWKAFATCSGGVLTLTIQVNLDGFPTTILAFSGSFDISGVATNTNLCSEGAIVGGGAATYSP